jgi:hypothetical protein
MSIALGSFLFLDVIDLKRCFDGFVLSHCFEDFAYDCSNVDARFGLMILLR